MFCAVLRSGLQDSIRIVILLNERVIVVITREPYGFPKFEHTVLTRKQLLILPMRIAIYYIIVITNEPYGFPKFKHTGLNRKQLLILPMRIIIYYLLEMCRVYLLTN